MHFGSRDCKTVDLSGHRPLAAFHAKRPHDSDFWTRDPQRKQRPKRVSLQDRIDGLERLPPVFVAPVSPRAGKIAPAGFRPLRFRKLRQHLQQPMDRKAALDGESRFTVWHREPASVPR